MSSPLTNDPTTELREALRQLRAGQPAAAEASARQALGKVAAHPAALSLLALALSAQQRASDALPAYQSLVEIEPTVAAHWSNLGNCLCELGREREAMPALQQALKLGFEDAALHFGLARAYAVVGPARIGLDHIDVAIAHAPADTEFRLLRAKLLIAIDSWDLANRAIDELQHLPLATDQRIELGYLLLRGGLYADAERLFRTVLQRDPLEPDAQLGLISTLERINRVDDAARLRAHLDGQLDGNVREQLHAKLLEVDARLAARRGDHDAAREALLCLLSGAPADPTLRISLRFDLAAALDKLRQPDAAMAHLSIAHAERRALVNDDHPALTREDNVYAALDEPLPLLRAWPQIAGDGLRRDPIFVVGFPRSGTTLLEQLLDAHSELASFDEQAFVQRLVKGLYGNAASLQQAMDRLDGAKVRQLRDRYFADIAQVRPDLGARRPVDKNPLNLVRLPLLPHFFPQSRVILAIRHPCDVVLSCYMQHFQAPSFAVTLETLDAGAEMYDRVFSHWWAAREAFALPVHVLRYEDLVADTESQARSLFDFLELPWEPQLMHFTERAREKGAISTPSYSQVIERVNARAVGRWHAYRHHFSGAALARLGPWIERFGYPPAPRAND